MCGRYMLATPRERLIARFRIQHAAELVPRYNIAPSKSVATRRENVNQERELVVPRWGLVPSTTKDTKNSYRMINARAETLSQRPALQPPLLPYDATRLVAYPVSKRVNHPKNDDAECIRQLQA